MSAYSEHLESLLREVVEQVSEGPPSAQGYHQLDGPGLRVGWLAMARAILRMPRHSSHKAESRKVEGT